MPASTDTTRIGCPWSAGQLDPVETVPPGPDNRSPSNHFTDLLVGLRHGVPVDSESGSSKPWDVRTVPPEHRVVVSRQMGDPRIPVHGLHGWNSKRRRTLERPPHHLARRAQRPADIVNAINLSAAEPHSCAGQADPVVCLRQSLRFPWRPLAQTQVPVPMPFSAGAAERRMATT